MLKNVRVIEEKKYADHNVNQKHGSSPHFKIEGIYEFDVAEKWLRHFEYLIAGD